MSEKTKFEAWLVSGCPSAGVAELKVEFGSLQPSDRNVSRETFLEGLETAVSSGKINTKDGLSAFFLLSPLLISAKDFVRASEQSRSPEERLVELVIAALARLSPAARGELIASLIREVADISLLCGMFVAAPGMDFGPETEALRNSLLLRVEKMWTLGAIWLQASPAQILWFFWACQEQQTYILVQRAFNDPKALQALLDVAIERRLTPQGEIDLILVRRWSKILDFQGLEAKALELALNGTSRQERARARRFLTAFGNGKSELYN
jgi:hypothetical protein